MKKYVKDFFSLKKIKNLSDEKLIPILFFFLILLSDKFIKFI